MKNLLILIICFGIHSAAFSQIITDIDEVYPLHSDLAAIKKDNQWAFINKNGEKVIDFRNDLVLTEKVNSLNETNAYPVFNDGRCLIRKLMENTLYFGYINEKGAEIIKPQFLNATNFSNGFAIVVVFYQDSIGFNEVLKIPVMSSKMEEYVINTSGERVKYLYNPKNYIPSNYKIKAPAVESKFIAPNLVATKNKRNKWQIHQF
ncbi:WG repeat-containing protein [Lutibacter sp.]|uniref:WG repeat-containing protein n=1 Tax=Lutibacter sp. TaxID=1925666 RepID=UPI003567B4B6